MKKVVMLAVLMGWMGVGCCQSRCNGTRCMAIKQGTAQKIESKSSPQVDSQSRTVNYLSIQPDGQ